VKTYVDWAVKQGFSVIDVNLPKHVTLDEGDTQDHQEADDVASRTREATSLLTYLWDNYVEINDATHVFLMGTNTGHGAIVNFIRANEDRAQARITKAISFVEDVPFQSVKSATNEELAKWYYFNSLVFVADAHLFWSSEYARKIKKRFGHVFKSADNSISDMLQGHQDEVTRELLRDTAAWRARRLEKVEDEEMAEVEEPEPVRRPPIGNFALSPARNSDLNRTSSPKGPPVSNFALSGRNGPPRNPAR